MPSPGLEDAQIVSDLQPALDGVVLSLKDTVCSLGGASGYTALPECSGGSVASAPAEVVPKLVGSGVGGPCPSDILFILMHCTWRYS